MILCKRLATLGHICTRSGRIEDEMTTQMLFTALMSAGGLAGIINGLWVIRCSKITLRRGATIETITGRAAQRLGMLIVLGAISITLVGLLVLRPMF
jgi:hypothetical protein